MLGSFRPIKTETLLDISMEEMTYGWPVEMVVKQAKKSWRIRSVPIPYGQRLGKSKLSGTGRGSILAAYYMFLLPVCYSWKD